MGIFSEWIDPLGVFGIMFVLGSLGGFGGLFAAGKAITAYAMGEAIFKGGCLGGTSGLLVNVQLANKALAIISSVLVGGGWIAKEEIFNWLLSIRGKSSQTRNDE